jgi:hypothetical protein
MIRATAIFALAVLSGLGVKGTQVSQTPVQKVIEMMNEMLAKGKAEKEKEAATYAIYKEWVDDKTQETGFEIKTLNSQIEEQTAEAEKADADVAELSAKIQELDGLIGGWEADQKSATDLRDSEHAEFVKVQADYSESLDAIDRAIIVLESQSASVAQPEMLLQKMATKSAGMQRVLAAFLQMKAADAGNGAPAVAAYEFQSGGIVTLLEKLKKKFKGELSSVEEEEANSAHAYDLEMLHLGDSIEAAKADRSGKAEANAQRAADSAEAKALLATAKTDLAVTEKFLADLKATFKAKTAAFNDNQKVREEEIAAIAKAIEIISDPKVAGAADKHLPGLIQHKKAVSLLQVSRSTHRVKLSDSVAAFLQKRAAALGSKVLAQAAAKVGFDPFAKVIEMVKSLIAKLEEEAAAEAGHKAWCDEQLKENKIKRDTKTAEVATLTAEVDKLNGEIATYAKELEELAAAQAALAKAMKEPTAFRETEKAENMATIKDAKEAQEAVDQALTILKDFYAKQAALLQGAQVPEMAAYKGMAGAKKGVIGMLEVILSDFARLEAETTADENQAQNEYDEFMSDSKADAKAKHDEEFKKELLKDKKEHALKGKKEDLEGTQAELDAALQYYAELKPQCLEVHVSYEERVAKRKEEIEALKQAYEMLNAYKR